MPLYTNFNAIFRHPLNRDKRREFRRSRPSRQAEREQHQAEREQIEAARQALSDRLEVTRRRLDIANSSLYKLIRGHDEVQRQHEAAIVAARAEASRARYPTCAAQPPPFCAASRSIGCPQPRTKAQSASKSNAPHETPGRDVPGGALTDIGDSSRVESLGRLF